MIVDCHCHAGKGDGLTGPWDTAAPLTKYLRRASAAGIDRTVIFAAFHSDYSTANAEVARIVASINANWPQRFYGFAFVNAERNGRRVKAMIQQAVTQFGFCGMKVHRHDARITREVCDAARAFIHGIDNFEAMRGGPYNVGLSDANLSKLELCQRIQQQLPSFVFLESSIGRDPDQRDYRSTLAAPRSGAEASISVRGWSRRRCGLAESGIWMCC